MATIRLGGAGQAGASGQAWVGAGVGGTVVGSVETVGVAPPHAARARATNNSSAPINTYFIFITFSLEGD